MKIVFDGENKETKEVEEVKPKFETKYFVEKKSGGNSKQLGTLVLGLTGGIIGGVLSTILVLDAKGVDKIQTNVSSEGGVTNSIVTINGVKSIKILNHKKTKKKTIAGSLLKDGDGLV